VSDKKLRGYFLQALTTFVDKELSAHDREQFMSRISAEDRATLAEAKQTDWYPMSTIVRLLDALRETYGDEKSARDALVRYGQTVAGEAAGSFMRLFMKMVTPQLLFKQFPTLWQKYANFGKFSNDQIGETSFKFSVSEVAGWKYQPLIGEGWTRFMMEAMKKRSISVELDPPTGLLTEGSTIRWHVTYS
jgi:uncharacterized protein (TIGR02265 family)